jgi:aspartyl-tRNA(Asn)/glutamyl-tRNA(Gln) amidotransferase subunit C
MSIDKATAQKIGRLSRIRLSDADADYYAKELTGILKWIEQLQEVNTEGVEPLASVSDVTLPMRADAVTDGNMRDAVLKNAPDAEYGCFTVPKVIE